MFMKLLALSLMAVWMSLFAQSDNESAKQDAKDAAHSTANAAKNTGHKTKQATQKGVHKSAHATKKGAKKLEDKTSPTPTPK